MIRVQAAQSVADIESYYRLTGASLDDYDLQLPTAMRDWRLGSRAALIQFIITWARRQSSARLVTHIRGNEQPNDQLHKFCRREHGLAALIVASDVLTSDRGSSLRVEADDAVRHRLQLMYDDANNCYRGPNAFFLCSDDSEWGKLPALYDSTPGRRLRSREDFQNLIAATVTRATGYFGKRVELLSTEYRAQIGRILYELFKNTDEWATRDLDDAPISKSVRGVLCEVHADVTTLSQSTHANAPLGNYLDYFVGEKHELPPPFLELSVFDSGPGLAGRNLGRELGRREPASTEYTAVMSCLTAGRTSSTDFARGFGLHSVLSILSQRGGFVRLRTGRLSLYRNLLVQPYTVEEPVTDMLDWLSTSGDLTVLSRTQGTLWSMLIPLHRYSPTNL